MLSALLLAAALQPPRSVDLLPTDPAAPGCALDVRKDGHVIEQRASGLANLETPAPIRADTVFEAGSVSKQFIGAGIAVLAEQGRLGLEDPIAKWLPELPPLYRDVTILMLLNHTSGIRSWNNLAELTGRGEDSTGYDNGWVLRAVARQTRLNHQPGAEYLYSNANFVLAATIIERASGLSLNNFFREALFARLGMTRSQWRTDFRAVIPGRAQAYLPGGKGGWQLDMPLNGVVGAGGLLTTVGDLQRWADALANPAPADRGWTARLLRSGQLSDGTMLRYGLGIETGPVAGQPAFAHAGSTGSYRAWLGLFPKARLSIALFCNSGQVNTEDLGPQIAARFLPSPAAAVRDISAPISAPVDLAGLYRNMANDAAVTVTVDAAGLHLNGGVGFGQTGVDRLTTADGTRTANILRDLGGVAKGLRVTRFGNGPVLLERAEAWTPTNEVLKRLAGRYESAEIDGGQTIALVGDQLVWRDPSGAQYPLVATYRDAFEAPDTGWTLRFRHEANGELWLDMSITRARRITFKRVPALADRSLDGSFSGRR